jgi:hypothetical protein
VFKLAEGKAVIRGAVSTKPDSRGEAPPDASVYPLIGRKARLRSHGVDIPHSKSFEISRPGKESRLLARYTIIRRAAK